MAANIVRCIGGPLKQLYVDGSRTPPHGEKVPMREHTGGLIAGHYVYDAKFGIYDWSPTVTEPIQ